MNFSALSIRNPIPAILLFVLLTLAGLYAFWQTRVQNFPDVQLPVVIATLVQPGVAPAQLETEITRKVEDAVARTSGIRNIYSTVRDGTSTTVVEFELEKNITDAMTEVRDAIAGIRSDLPADMREPVVSKLSTAGRVVDIYAVQLAPDSGWNATQLGWFVDNTVVKRLLAVPGVGDVRRTGGVQREVQVLPDPARMQALGVTAADISRLLAQTQQEAPSGRAQIGSAEQTMRTLAIATQASDLAALPLALPTGATVRLGDVATITDTHAEQRARALLDGHEAIGLEVFRTRGASEVDVSRQVAAAMQEIRHSHPNVRITHVVNNATSVQDNFDGSMHMLYEGAVLAVLVVFAFLRDWRATFVAATALPLSIIPAFLGMYWLGYSLNLVTLLALALVVGVLVDDAIVEIENIERHLAMGKPPLQAALEAADEIGMAVIATTFALVAVFLPTAFMDGVPGLYFKQFGWTAVLAILASLVVARLLTPMMAAYLLKPHVHQAEQADTLYTSAALRHTSAHAPVTQPAAAHSPIIHSPATHAAASGRGHGGGDGDRDGDGWLMRHYMRTVQWCLRHQYLTLALAVLLFVASLGLAGLIPTGFVPPTDRGQTQVQIDLPPGSTLAQTQAAAEAARHILARDPAVLGVYTSVGGGASSSDGFNPGAAPDMHRAVLTVNLLARTERSDSLATVENRLRQALSVLPGVRVTLGNGDTGSKLVLVLLGDDPQVLQRTASQAERELRGLPGIGSVTSDAALVQPEVVIRPDWARAADLGISAAAIAQTVRVATAGDYDQYLPKLTLADRQVPIRVRLPDASRHSIDTIRQLPLHGSAGLVPLAAVAEVDMTSGPSVISRINRSRSIKLSVELGGRNLGEVDRAARQLPTLRQLPAGVRLAELGDAQEMRALFASFGLAMLIGVLCIYSVLVLLFGSFLHPVTILGALPLAVGGAFVALLLTGHALSMPSLIGLIMLMGIVTKNSILLVDYAIIAQREGMDRYQALLDACHKRSRPIIMTTIAMGAGMLPLALGLGAADSSFRAPMAVTVIGGLLTSTLLSLLVVPAFYLCMDDVGSWLGRWRHRRPSMQTA